MARACSDLTGSHLQGGQSFANGIFRKFGYALNVQLTHDLLAMRFDGLHTQAEPESDFLCSLTLSLFCAYS